MNIKKSTSPKKASIAGNIHDRVTRGEKRQVEVERIKPTKPQLKKISTTLNPEMLFPTISLKRGSAEEASRLEMKRQKLEINKLRKENTELEDFMLDLETSNDLLELGKTNLNNTIDSLRRELDGLKAVERDEQEQFEQQNNFADEIQMSSVDMIVDGEEQINMDIIPKEPTTAELKQTIANLESIIENLENKEADLATALQNNEHLRAACDKLNEQSLMQDDIYQEEKSKMVSEAGQQIAALNENIDKLERSINELALNAQAKAKDSENVIAKLIAQRDSLNQDTGFLKEQLQLAKAESLNRQITIAQKEREITQLKKETAALKNQIEVPAERKIVRAVRLLPKPVKGVMAVGGTFLSGIVGNNLSQSFAGVVNFIGQTFFSSESGQRIAGEALQATIKYAPTISTTVGIVAGVTGMYLGYKTLEQHNAKEIKEFDI